MHNVKVVFFDMDGVLYDSMPNHEYSWIKTFEAENLFFSPEEAYANEGRTGSGTINIVFDREFGRNATHDEVERIYHRKSEIMNSCPEVSVFPSMRELLLSLPKKDVEVYVVTGSRQPSLVDKLSHTFGVRPSNIVSGADVVKGKPDPEPYLMAWERSGVEKKECLVVENAPLGIISGKAAGLTVWAVNTGKLADCVLLDAGADKLFHNTVELADAILKTIEKKV